MSDHQTPVEALPAKTRFNTAEEYFTARDAFLVYCEDEVNPARVANGLKPLDLPTAREAFRIIDEFCVDWSKSK